MKRFLARIPLIGRILLIFLRLYKTLPFILTPIYNYLRWLIVSKETTNFTYDLEELNMLYMKSFVAEVTDKSFQEVATYVDEIQNDQAFQQFIWNIYQSSSESFKADKDVKLGRRMGWYAIIRATKPKVVIETGVDKGLGSCVITAALKKNTEEGFPGRYYGTDINPRAGYLLQAPYANYGEILYGDSIETLKKFTEKIDIFINDSDHSETYEMDEYRVIQNNIHKNTILIGDNSHISAKLQDFALETNRKFLYHHEIPKKHWYPGCGLGVAYHQSDI
ncbi:MAG: class I SAM-dependent methyltransferase [Microscillaceae bacterium]|nr:class I SAM-dependent methyltransferase [Microscillaceae bacterium]